MEVEVPPIFLKRVHFWVAPSYVRLNGWLDPVRVPLGSALLNVFSLIFEREGLSSRPSHSRPGISPAYEVTVRTLSTILSKSGSPAVVRCLGRR